MNAVKMLKADHDRVQKLFKEFEAAGERAYEKKRGIAEEVFTELEIHTKLEEEIFYPAVQARADKEGEELLAESLQEHHVVDVLMQEIKQLEPSDERFEAKMTVLIENVEHHIEEEEQEMLPDAKKKLGKEVEALGDQMEQRKQQLMAAVA